MQDKQFQTAFRLWVATAVLLFFTALYSLSITRVMRMDEAYTLRNFTFSMLDTLFSYYVPNNHLLHSLFVGISETFIGNSPIGVRFPAFCAGLLALALSYRVGKRAGGHSAGLLSMIFLGTNFTFADYSINARGYSLAICLTLLLIDLLAFRPVPRSRRYNYALMATTFALVLTLPSMVLLLVGVGLWVLWKARSQPRFLRVLPPMIVGSVISALIYVGNLLLGRLTAYLTTFGANDGRIPLSTLLTEWLTMVFSTPVIAWLMGAAVMFGFGLMWQQRNQRSLLLLLMMILLTAAGITIIQSAVLGKVFFARNYLYLLVPITLIAGVGISRLPKSGWIAPALLIFAIVPLLNLSQPTEIDAFIARVDAHLQPTDAIIVGCCLAESTWYHLLQTERVYLMEAHPQVERVLIAERSQYLQTTISDYQLEGLVSDCQLLESWAPFEVFECRYTRKL